MRMMKSYSRRAQLEDTWDAGYMTSYDGMNDSLNRAWEGGRNQGNFEGRHNTLSNFEFIPGHVSPIFKVKDQYQLYGLDDVKKPIVSTNEPLEFERQARKLVDPTEETIGKEKDLQYKWKKTYKNRTKYSEVDNKDIEDLKPWVWNGKFRVENKLAGAWNDNIKKPLFLSDYKKNFMSVNVPEYIKTNTKGTTSLTQPKIGGGHAESKTGTFETIANEVFKGRLTHDADFPNRYDENPYRGNARWLNEEIKRREKLANQNKLLHIEGEKPKNKEEQIPVNEPKNKEEQIPVNEPKNKEEHIPVNEPKNKEEHRVIQSPSPVKKTAGSRRASPKRQSKQDLPKSPAQRKQDREAKALTPIKAVMLENS